MVFERDRKLQDALVEALVLSLLDTPKDFQDFMALEKLLLVEQGHGLAKFPAFHAQWKGQNH